MTTKIYIIVEYLLDCINDWKYHYIVFIYALGQIITHLKRIDYKLNGEPIEYDEKDITIVEDKIEEKDDDNSN